VSLFPFHVLVPEFEVSAPLPVLRAFAESGPVLAVKEEEEAMERTIELGGKGPRDPGAMEARHAPIRVSCREVMKFNPLFEFLVLFSVSSCLSLKRKVGAPILTTAKVVMTCAGSSTGDAAHPVPWVYPGGLQRGVEAARLALEGQARQEVSVAEVAAVPPAMSIEAISDPSVEGLGVADTSSAAVASTPSVSVISLLDSSASDRGKGGD
jgi:hypothetical protein